MKRSIDGWMAAAALWHGRRRRIALQATAQPPGPPPPQRSARESAPIDLTGQWVSIVTEDWRFRMVTPPAGDSRGDAS